MSEGARGQRHERALLDALEARQPEVFDADVWRCTLRGRDPLEPSSAAGRWSRAGEGLALYTSVERDGAVAEVGYRLSLEPVWPSRVEHVVYRIHARTQRSLRFPDVASLVPFGIDAARHSSFEYSATQALAAAARFLDFDSLIVPSARSPLRHVVIFLSETTAAEALTLIDSETVDWKAWRRARSA